MQRRRALALLTSAVMGSEMLRASPTGMGGQWGLFRDSPGLGGRSINTDANDQARNDT
jgi:hypothetical protein